MTPVSISKNSYFYKIIDDKFKKYKKSRKNIWKIHNIQLKECCAIEYYRQACFSYCMWELNHEISFKNKLSMLRSKMEHKISKYIDILRKITNNNLLDDVMIYISEFLISNSL
tara:strand:+ start:3186 stop:3524 length:339 start_codon:yes stop_codon:yes gene_type:complete